MSALDILLILPLAYGAWKGYSNGFVKEVAQLLGLVIALFLAFHLMNSVADWVSAKTGLNGTVAHIGAFLLIFGAVMFVVSGLVYGLNVILKITLLSIPNRIMGLVFGVLKAGVAVSVLLTMLASIGLPEKGMVEKSKLIKHIKPLASTTYNVVALIVPGATTFVKDVENEMAH